MKKESTKFLRNNISLIIAIVLLLIGIAVCFYPSISNYIAKKNQTEVIQDYIENITSKDDFSQEWEKAKTYNENLAGNPVHDPFVAGSGYAIPTNYSEVLDINGIMGYIEIPKISVNLPIYHGTSEEVLSKGVGHIEATSVPIGGKGTHCVLTGHTGLPSAELFTRLDELKIGDYFYINVLDEVLTYKVNQILTVLPTELDSLQLEEDKDLVTLITCTPYGINTHRLLVRAERTDYIPPDKVIENLQQSKEKKDLINYTFIGIVIGIGLLAIILIIIFIMTRKKHKGKRYYEK